MRCFENGNDDFGVEAFWIGDAARVGYFVPLNGPLNGHPPSFSYRYDFHSSYLHCIITSSFSSMCSLLSLIMLHGASSLVSSVILIANKQGLKADLWCSPTFVLDPCVTPTAHLTVVVFSSFCTILTCFSATPTCSCNTSSLLLTHCHKLSPGPLSHRTALPYLLCTSLHHRSQNNQCVYSAFLWHENVLLFPYVNT